MTTTSRPIVKLEDLPDDCLLLVLSYFSGPKLIYLSGLSTRFKNVIESPDLWRHSVVTGSVLRATNLVEKGLVPRARFIKHLSFEDVCAPPLLPLDDDLGLHLSTSFYVAVDNLLSKCGPHLQSLSILDSDESFFYNNAHLLFESVAQYGRNLKKIVLAGKEATMYAEDSSILLLTMGCRKVEEFVDGQAFGITIEAINMMVDGWQNLRSLTIQTEMQDVETFAKTVAQFGPRIRSLSITNFRGPLNEPESLAHLASGLNRLTNLERVSIDLQMTKYTDGMRASDWAVVLDSCPHIKKVQYLAAIEAYFDDDELDTVEDALRQTGIMRSGQQSPSESGLGGLRFTNAAWRFLGSRAARAALAGDEETRRWIQSVPLAISGSWSSGDGKELEAQSQLKRNVVNPYCREFFRILDGIRQLCEERGLVLEIQWFI